MAIFKEIINIVDTKLVRRSLKEPGANEELGIVSIINFTIHPFLLSWNTNSEEGYGAQGRWAVAILYCVAKESFNKNKTLE